jgi:hypothetical protein
MSTIKLTLNISILKAIVVLCRITGESLRRSFADEYMEPHERRAIFAQWIRVRWNMELAERLLCERALHCRFPINLGWPSTQLARMIFDRIVR